MPTPGYSPDRYGGKDEEIDLSVNKPGSSFRVDRRYSAYVDKSIIRMIHEAGEKLAKNVRTAIEDQVYAWRPLSEKYLEWKINNDLDERILIATGEYISMIKAWPTEDGVEIGLPSKVDHTQNGVPLRLLARWLEYGTKNEDGSWKMWPRPHWRPQIRDWKNNELPAIRNRIKKRIQQNMVLEMRKRVHTMLTVLR